MNCPNCGTRNTKSSAYCAKCGFRLPTAAGRGAGVAYRRADTAEPHGGGGTGLLAFGAVLLAGMLFAVGAVALFLSAPPAPSGSPILGADASPTSTLGIFVQETPTPPPPPTNTPVPSSFFTPTPLLTLPIDTPILSPTIPVITPPPPSTPPPSRTPRPPTPTPTATPTPTNPPLGCATAPGTNIKAIVIGTGNAPSHGPINKAWCIHTVIFRPYLSEPGTTRLFVDGRRIATDHCTADECNAEQARTFALPRLAPAGSTLIWEFTCIDNPGTPEDECTTDPAGGSTVEVQYEVLPGT